MDQHDEFFLKFQQINARSDIKFVNVESNLPETF